MKRRSRSVRTRAAIVFFVTEWERRLILRALRRLDRDRRLSLLKALGLTRP